MEFAGYPRFRCEMTVSSIHIIHLHRSLRQHAFVRFDDDYNPLFPVAFDVSGRNPAEKIHLANIVRIERFRGFLHEIILPSLLIVVALLQGYKPHVHRGVGINLHFEILKISLVEVRAVHRVAVLYNVNLLLTP